MPTISPWQPILDGALAEEALTVVLQIAAALAEPEAGVEGACLSGGAAGAAVLHTYLERALPDRGYGERALVLLEHAVGAVEELPMLPSLYSGFTGIAWTVEHLRGHLLADDAEDACATIDEALLEYLAERPWTSHYDLVSGLGGFAVYALERWPRPAARALLAEVVARLDEIAEKKDGQVTWWTAPALLTVESRAEFPEGYYNLGVAHGVPGLVAVLGRIAAVLETSGTAAATDAVTLARTRGLLDGAIAWVRSHEQQAERSSAYANQVVPGRETRDARSAWCYGDPGVAAALFTAARACTDAGLAQHALALGRRAIARPATESGVIDAGLCHGAAGLGHLYHRLYQASGDAMFREAARAWLLRTLRSRRPGQGIAGFLFRIHGMQNNVPAEGAWRAHRGLLSGGCGVALALLAAVTPIAPDWDRLLLLS